MMESDPPLATAACVVSGLAPDQPPNADVANSAVVVLDASVRVPNRVSYGLFSREIAKRNSAVRWHCRNNLAQLRAQLKEARSAQRRHNHDNNNKNDNNNGDNGDSSHLKKVEEEIKAKIEEVKAMRQKNREEHRQARRTLKVQLQELKAKQNGWQITAAPTGMQLELADPWIARFPNMHKLFHATKPKLREKIDGEIASLLSSEDARELPKLVSLIEHYMQIAAPQSHVIDFVLMDAVVNALGDHFTLILRLLLEHPELFAKSAAESDHHDLFEKVVLMKGEKSGWKLRMHVFIPENFMVAQEEVHSHRNHFQSRIMYGGFSHELWEPLPTEEGQLAPDVHKLHKYIYNPLVSDNGGRVFNLETMGEVHLKKLEEVSVMAGQSYYMHTSVLHSVSSICGCTVTLVLNAPQTNPTSCFATFKPWDQETFERRGFTHDELRNQIQHVLQLVASMPSQESEHASRAEQQQQQQKQQFMRAELREN